jgi:hypothetical protein
MLAAADLPVSVLPAGVLLDSELDGIAKLALLNLDAGFLAFFAGAASTLVGRRL